MKKTKIIYWIFTSLFCFMMAGSALPDILVSPIAVEGFSKMGFPVYLIPFLGVAKMLGVIAVLVPGFPRLREWAYAGLVFDLLGATYSLICMAPSQPGNWVPMALPLLLAAGSYTFYHKLRRSRTAQNGSGQMDIRQQQQVA